MYPLVFRNLLASVLWTVVLLGTAAAQAVNASNCTLSPTLSYRFNVRIGFCLEVVIEDDSAGELGFTALAMGDGGTLYAARPLRGEVFALTDSTSDGLPDQPRLLLEGLDTPSALAFADGTLYVVAGTQVLAWRDGTLRVLIDDLPTGGIWHGGLVVHDGTLYVGVSAACDTCDDRTRGLVLAYDLSSGARRVFARGLREPRALGVVDGTLWAGDIAPYAYLGKLGMDELNALEEGGDYGFPRCIGIEGDCDGTHAPRYRFPAQAQPYALLTYTGAAFPEWRGDLLVLLAGTPHTPNPLGYQLLAIRRQGDTSAVLYAISPYHEHGFNNEEVYDGANIWLNRTAGGLAKQGYSFYPHHAYGLVQSPEGWLYLSVGGGGIYALRPNTPLDTR